MSDINWIQVGAGVLGGGAFGALIKQYFENRRNRIQPIAFTKEITSVYDSSSTKLIDSQIILSDEAKEYKFSKLYTGVIEILNTSVNDFMEFKMGVTCDSTTKFIQVRLVAEDRHHNVDYSNHPSLQNQISEFDITLKPFNRTNCYKFDVLITTQEETLEAADIEISSPHPVKWVEIKPTSDNLVMLVNRTLVSKLLDSVISIRVGPF